MNFNTLFIWYFYEFLTFFHQIFLCFSKESCIFVVEIKAGTTLTNLTTFLD